MEGATGIYWVEARDSTNYSTMYRSVPTTKSDLVQNVTTVPRLETLSQAVSAFNLPTLTSLSWGPGWGISGLDNRHVLS